MSRGGKVRGGGTAERITLLSVVHATILHVPCTSTREAKAAQDTFTMSTFCREDASHLTCISGALWKQRAHTMRSHTRVCES